AVVAQAVARPAPARDAARALRGGRDALDRAVPALLRLPAEEREARAVGRPAEAGHAQRAVGDLDRLAARDRQHPELRRRLGLRAQEGDEAAVGREPRLGVAEAPCQPARVALAGE